MQKWGPRLGCYRKNNPTPSGTTHPAARSCPSILAVAVEHDHNMVVLQADSIQVCSIEGFAVGTWYYRASGKEIGPLKSSELVTHIRQGRVTPDTMIRKQDSQWVAAREVGGLFEAADKRSQTEHICPFCGESIPKPPVRCPNCSRDVVVSFKGKTDAIAEARKKPELTPEEAQQRREQAIAELQEQARKRDILVYSICLLLWAVLLVSAPYLLRLADDGTIDIHRHAMAAILGVVGLTFAFTAYWLTRSG